MFLVLNVRPGLKQPVANFCGISRRAYLSIDADCLTAMAKGRCPIVTYIGSRHACSKLQYQMIDQLNEIFQAGAMQLNAQKEKKIADEMARLELSLLDE